MDKVIFEDYASDENDEDYLYVLSSPNSLYNYFAKLSFDKNSDCILDVGSGVGKALCLVFSKFFKKSIGVEINKSRYEISKRNIELLKLENKVEVINVSAFTYKIPTYINAFYFYNPFFEFKDDTKPLKKVLDNIKQSLIKKPRPIHLFFYNPESKNTIFTIVKKLKLKILSATLLQKNAKIYYLYSSISNII